MTANPAHPQSLSRVEEQHRQLRQTLAQVEATSDLALLLTLLRRLRTQLREHFADEEGDGGLADAVMDSAPERLRRLDALFAEHREFLDATDELIARVDTILNRTEAQVLGDVHALARRLHDHEARETELLTDAVFTDTGGGD